MFLDFQCIQSHVFALPPPFLISLGSSPLPGRRLVGGAEPAAASQPSPEKTTYLPLQTFYVL